MHTYTLEQEQLIPLSRSETFKFFCDAFNLERLTPPFLQFHITTPPPIEMADGAIIDYELKLYGIKFRWRTLIETWRPENYFVDRQIKGPYLLWHHTHTFEEIAPNRTLMRDQVLYQLPFGIFGRLAHWLFIRRSLKTIFDYRAKVTAELLGEVKEPTA
jgi:ligand-binding SRPBCC domain-containing protein